MKMGDYPMIHGLSMGLLMDYQWISHEFPERFPKWWIYTKSSTQQIKDDLNLRYTEIKFH